MLVGVFADSHDHLDHLRRLVELFNDAGCDQAIFAGDFVSTFALPPLRKLRCRLTACFGDNEGNHVGIEGGMQILGTIGRPPFCLTLSDGSRCLLTHQRELVKTTSTVDFAVFAHTHRWYLDTDSRGTLWMNPGELSGWSYGHPTVGFIDTDLGTARIEDLNGQRLAEAGFARAA